MKFTRMIKETIDVDTLRMSLAVRYDDEDMPSGFPFSLPGNVWNVDVDLATGKIKGWPGPAYDLFMKVCDEGTYSLLSGGEVVATREGYVPNGVVPGEYGDYVDLKIAADGTITNWPKLPDLSAFEE